MRELVFVLIADAGTPSYDSCEIVIVRENRRCLFDCLISSAGPSLKHFYMLRNHGLIRDIPDFGRVSNSASYIDLNPLISEVIPVKVVPVDH
jgi:hypothetical protein